MPKILVADDNTNIQKMVSLALEERGIHVVSVGNGEAAVRRIPDLDPDLVLADIFMPVRNGYEVCEFVKKDDRFSHVPVILLVGAFDPLDEKEARRVGADGVLKKPFVPPDPLIAMVTSALEKNPRVAAEMAKAKEAKAAPPPEPLPAVELTARPEPKPLPEFPEPSEEEAELVYGFGKGHRSLDRAGTGAAEDEAPAPKLDAAAQAAQDAQEDEEDTASTASDWRRSAMDFEIPEDLASKPAIPSNDSLDAISFPSEKDFPPRRVPRPEPVEEAQPEAANEPSSANNGFSLRQVKGPAVPAADNELSAAKAHDGLKPHSEPETPPPFGLHPTREPAPPAADLPEPNSTALGSHWLDAVSAPQADNASGDWMEALVSGSGQEESESAASQEPHAEARIEPESAVPPEIEALSSPEMLDAPIVMPTIAPAAAAPEAPVAKFPYEPASADALQQDDRHEERSDEREDQAEAGDSFFADEAEPEASVAAAEESEHPSGFFAPDAARASDPGEIEMDADDSEPSPALKDPGLVEPPAVHVTPEPLLVDEEPAAAPRYGSAGEDTAPLHSFLAPAPEISAVPPSSEEPSASGHPAAAEFSVQPESEPSTEEFSERVPTMAPPNREALSHIPFLTPPPSFLAEINAAKLQEGARGTDAATVDAVVQKVLEKLQPQLEEVLSQGLLKPLVENILQSEVEKKR